MLYIKFEMQEYNCDLINKAALAYARHRLRTRIYGLFIFNDMLHCVIFKFISGVCCGLLITKLCI